MPVVEALRAATCTAADVIGRADRAGRVTSGLSADLLVVDSDPRNNLRALLDPFLVLRRGRPQNKEGRTA